MHLRRGVLLARLQEHGPVAGAPSVHWACGPTAELSVVTGACGGIDAGNLVLEKKIFRDDPTHEGFSSGGSVATMTSHRSLCALREMNLELLCLRQVT